MGKSVRPDNLNQDLLLSPSLRDWLPEKHLAHFVADVVGSLDLGAIYCSYEEKDGRGQAAYARKRESVGDKLAQSTTERTRHRTTRDGKKIRTPKFGMNKLIVRDTGDDDFKESEKGIFFTSSGTRSRTTATVHLIDRLLITAETPTSVFESFELLDFGMSDRRWRDHFARSTQTDLWRRPGLLSWREFLNPWKECRY